MAIVEDILNNPKISEESVKNSIQDVLQSREDAKSRQNNIFQKMLNYAAYGKDNVRKYFVNSFEKKFRIL